MLDMCSIPGRNMYSNPGISLVHSEAQGREEFSQPQDFGRDWHAAFDGSIAWLSGVHHHERMNEYIIQNLLKKTLDPWQLLIKWRFQSETLGSLDSEDLVFCVLVWREDAAASASWEIAQAYHVQHPLQRPVQTFAKVMPVSHAKSWWEQSQDELGGCFP